MRSSQIKSRQRQLKRLKKKFSNAKSLRYLSNPPAPAWRAAHADRSQPRNPILKPVIEKQLSVTTEFWSATSTWKKIYGVWSCTAAAPILKWMIGKNPSQVHLELMKLGAEFAWAGPASDCAVRGPAETPQEPSSNQTVAQRPLPAPPSPPRSTT